MRGRGPGMDMGRWLPPPERGMGWGAGGRRGPPYPGEPGPPWGGMGPEPMGYPDGPGGVANVVTGIGPCIASQHDMGLCICARCTARNKWLLVIRLTMHIGIKGSCDAHVGFTGVMQMVHCCSC